MCVDVGQVYSPPIHHECEDEEEEDDEDDDDEAESVADDDDDEEGGRRGRSRTNRDSSVTSSASETDSVPKQSRARRQPDVPASGKDEKLDVTLASDSSAENIESNYLNYIIETLSLLYHYTK